MPEKPARLTPYSGPDRQRDIYLAGAAGLRPGIPTDPEKLEAAARNKLDNNAFAYIAGGAGLGRTMAANRSGFDAWRIVPRMLRDVSLRDPSQVLLGLRLGSPLLLAPVGVLELAHPEADMAVARAAAARGVPMIFSNQASRPMEEVAAAMGDAPRWFQLYWSKSDELTASLVRRAEACGCSAIVVTLDTTLLGWRNQDLDLASLPFLQGKGIAQYVSDPVFQRLLEEPEEGPQPQRKITLSAIQTLIELTRAYPGGAFLQKLRSGLPLRAVRKFISIYSRPSLRWENLAFLRQHTNLPILLKGILHPEDAQMAVDQGINGIIVSNHGGRQVDGAISAIEALPGIAAAVQGRVPLLMDSGIRTGADMYKAIALGADAVCLGRPYVYGLALAGEQGVGEVLDNLRAEFDLTMGLAGSRNLSEISVEYLVKA